MQQEKGCRVRFAPSPTGYLHIGGVRTALFNYLFAHSLGGKFVLRIEDTDTERSNAVFTEDILKSLQWLGLNWDEGPIFQSQRLARYQGVCQELVTKGYAYYCYCTPEDLDAERKALEALKQKPQYSRRCLKLDHKAPDQKRGPAVIRFKVPLGETGFDDLTRGHIVFQNSEIEDFVILRANQTPTYNLACVVDDFDGRMTHIIRGDDHINNTPKQVLIFKALGFEPPLFAHLPMILGPDKKKLSKRHGAVSANQYRADGFLPEAVVNYLARLGWSHGDQEIFSKKELVQFFTLEKIGKSNAVFNPEKLLWLNGHYIREASEERLAEILYEDFSEDILCWGKITGFKEKLLSKNSLVQIAHCKQKVRTLRELANLVRPLIWEGEIPLDEKIHSQWSKNKLEAPFRHILTELEHLRREGNKTLFENGIDAKTLETLFRGTADRFAMKLVDLAQPTRFFIQGTTVGPALFDVVVTMPFTVIRERLEKAFQLLK